MFAVDRMTGLPADSAIADLDCQIQAAIERAREGHVKPEDLLGRLATRYLRVVAERETWRNRAESLPPKPTPQTPANELDTELEATRAELESVQVALVEQTTETARKAQLVAEMGETEYRLRAKIARLESTVEQLEPFAAIGERLHEQHKTKRAKTRAASLRKRRAAKVRELVTHWQGWLALVAPRTKAAKVHAMLMREASGGLEPHCPCELDIAIKRAIVGRAPLNCFAYSTVLASDPKSKPAREGSYGGWYTKGGRPIEHASAYSKKGWSNMQYLCTNAGATVGASWLRKNLKKLAQQRAAVLVK